MPHSTYLPERMGTAEISPTGKFEAGSFQSFTLVYTAGYFGIDDTGSIKIVHRFASDMGRPQWSDPKAANYTTAEASNGAVLDVLYDPKLNIRPWDKTLMIRVMRGFLREGDTITVRFGDPRQGSPGMRVQTFVEPTFEFRVLVDAFATCDYVELPVQPTIAIVAGPPVTLEGGVAHSAPRRRALPPRLQGRGQMGKSQRPGRGRVLAARQSPDPRLASSVFDATRRARKIDRRPVGCRAGRPADRGARRRRQGALRQQSLAHRCRGAAAIVLVRPARPVGGDDRHQLGAGTDRVCPRPRLPRRHEPSGQRLPDHVGVLERIQRPDPRIQRGRVVRHLPGLRMVGQHRARRRPQRPVPARGTADPPLLARAGRRPDRSRRPTPTAPSSCSRR